MGKDMASFAIHDFRSPKQVNIVLHPLIFKLYNAQNSGNYQGGLKPDYEIDEFATLPLTAFGDPQDPLLKKALEIAGAGTAKNTTSGNQRTISANLKYHSSVIRNQQHSNIEINKIVIP
ncbi:hypothetical protein D3C85_1018160 [compost metagenome]